MGKLSLTANCSESASLVAVGEIRHGSCLYGVHSLVCVKVRVREVACGIFSS